ncbi:hypothetical protein [Bacillus marasmi]|uniref:hypothetical protein n=1 Tax=Bacillus marasmi TaxID=1926279 RepID=UPI00164D1513|nr:hypothetical protein [Bacillus marasmi]
MNGLETPTKEAFFASEGGVEAREFLDAVAGQNEKRRRLFSFEGIGEPALQNLVLDL